MPFHRDEQIPLKLSPNTETLQPVPKQARNPKAISVFRFRYAPLLAPCRRPILIATKYMLFRGQDTSSSVHISPSVPSQCRKSCSNALTKAKMPATESHVLRADVSR